MASFFVRPARTCNRHRAFTLVELLVVIIIIGALSGMVAIGAEAMFSKAKFNRCLNDREILEREYKLAKLYDPDKSANDILKDIAKKNNGTFNTTTITEICPSGGYYAWILGNASDSSDVYHDEREIIIYCLEPGHGIPGQGAYSGEWEKGAAYNMGDTMIAGGFIFRCLKSHKSGSRSNTRNPTVKSNKGSWEVIGYKDGATLSYSPTVRYRVGLQVLYNGNIYTRTNYNLTGGQTPYSKSSSRYWTLIGPAE